MQIEKKDIYGGLFMFGLLALGLKFAADDAEEEYGNYGSRNVPEGAHLVLGSMNDLDAATQMMIDIILRGNVRSQGEIGFIRHNIMNAIQQGNLFFLVDNQTGRKIGFVFGTKEDITRNEIENFANVHEREFSRYQYLTGFKGFGLGVLPEYRNRNLGLYLMNCMKQRASELGCDYIWLGALSNLGNAQQWASRTDVVGSSDFMTFFASMVDRDLFAGR